MFSSRRFARVLRNVQKGLNLQKVQSTHQRRLCTLPKQLNLNVQPACAGEKTHPTIKTISETLEGDLSVEWSDGSMDEFPYVFLRDNCHCWSCFDNTSKSKLQTCSNVDIKSNGVDISEDGTSLTIQWPDNHKTDFTSDWLRRSSFNPAVQQECQERMLLEPPRDQPWGKEKEENIRSWEFDEILSVDDSLDSLLWELSRSGIAVLKTVPAERNMLRNLCERVAFLSPTHYGEKFEVYTRENAANFAYLPGPLPLHNDMVYNDPNPGIQIFHFLKQCQGEGGANTLVDGFNAAKQLQAENPEAFRLLTTNRAINCDRGEDPFVGKFFYCSHKPVIELCSFTDKIKSIHTNLAARNFRYVPRDQLKDMYRAYAAFEKLLNSPANMISVKSDSGDMLLLDNQRVLHGRTAFTAVTHEKGTTFRHIIGGYLEWKDVMSRLRVIRQTSGQFNAEFLH